jgi:ketosteroid isomerase-like protein
VGSQREICPGVSRCSHASAWWETSRSASSRFVHRRHDRRITSRKREVHASSHLACRCLPTCARSVIGRSPTNEAAVSGLVGQTIAAIGKRPYASGMTESNGSTTFDVFSALIADWNQAVVANDPDAIDAFAEPDWVFVGENGIFPGEQFLEAVGTGQVSHEFMTSEVHDVRVYGDVAIVIARVRNRGEFGGNPFTLDEWSTDVFVRRGDRWRCSVTHLTSVAATTPAT